MQEVKWKLKELCFEITNECLLNCIHCSSSSKVGEGYLDKESILRTINEFEEMGGKELEISGGEPLLHPNIWEILDYCKRRNFSTTLYTSGIGRALPSELANKINVDKAAVSLQGARKITEEVTGKDCYEQIKTFIKSLVENGIETEVHFVPMKQNYHDFENLLKECESIGVKNIKILRLIPQGRALDNWERIHVPEIELKEFLKRIYEIDTSIKIEIGNPLKPYKNERMNCKAAIASCLINSRGYVYPCPALKTDPLLSAGNIHEKSLTELWEEGFESIRKFREYVKHSDCLASWIKTY